MYWVTGRLIHFDRVASAWLISRFVDPEATFGFIEPGSTFPEGSITYSMAGGDIGRHDTEGTTFTKLLRRYKLTDPALLEVEKIVAAGVAYVMAGKKPGEDERIAWIAVGLLAVAEGLLVLENTDEDILRLSLPVWDAVYVDAGIYLLQTNPPQAESEALKKTRLAMTIARHRQVAGRARDGSR